MKFHFKDEDIKRHQLCELEPGDIFTYELKSPSKTPEIFILTGEFPNGKENSGERFAVSLNTGRVAWIDEYELVYILGAEMSINYNVKRIKTS